MTIKQGIPLLAGGFLSASAVFADRPEKPNFLIILADDLGWQDLKCYDIDKQSVFETPFIDALAKEGVLFTQAYSPAPTCAPSRCGIMTGKYPARLNKTHVYGGMAPKPWSTEGFRLMDPFYNGRLNLEEITIAEALKPAGYFSGQIGKWHMAANHHSFPQPKDQGFDWDRHDQGLSAKMRTPNRVSGFATSVPGDIYCLDKNGFAHDQTTTDAIVFMQEAGTRPFFCYFATWYVHYPIQTRTERLLKKYCDKMGVPFPSNDVPMKNPGQNNPYYAAMIEEFDYMVHRVVSFLKETDDPRWPGHKLIENTYVFLTSDNGGMEQHGPEVITDNYPLDEGKQWANEGGVRVPFIVTGPGIPENLRSEVMISGLDFYPTLLALAGQPLPNKVDGCSLKELLLSDPQNSLLVKHGDGTVRDTMYWHFPHGQAMHSAVRKGDWKLIRNFDPSNAPYELYRLYTGGTRDDIEEAKDVSAVYPEKLSEMKIELDGWFSEVNARMPHYNPKFSGPLANKEKVPSVTGSGCSGGKAWVTFGTGSGAKVVRADLIYTLNGGAGFDEEWFCMPAVLDAAAGRAEAAVPAGTTHLLFNLIDENNFLISSVDVGDMARARETKDSGRVPPYKAETPNAGAVTPDNRDVPASAANGGGMFSRLDANQDGQVTLDEYIGLFVPGAERKDVNRDGFLSPEEFPYAGSFKLGDADNDGLLTMDEVNGMYKKQFNGRDANKDGVVTANEM